MATNDIGTGIKGDGGMAGPNLRQVPQLPLLPPTRGEEEAGGEVGGAIIPTTGGQLAICGGEGGVDITGGWEGGYGAP